jgi:hypothetical protein
MNGRYPAKIRLGKMQILEIKSIPGCLWRFKPNEQAELNSYNGFPIEKTNDIYLIELQ